MMAHWSLGIDIGTAYTKVVGLDKRGEPVLVKRVPTPPTGFGGGEAQQVVNQLDALAPFALHQADIAACVPSQFVNSTVVTLPRMPGKDLASAAVYEARRTMIPRPGPEALFECQVVEEQNGDPTKAKVLVIKTERQGLEERFNLLKQAGLVPKVITTSSFALLHAVSPADRRKGSLAMVHLGARTLDVITAKDGQQRFFRSLNLGCRDMVPEMAKALRVSEQEAERLLLDSGTPDPAASTPAPSPDPRLQTVRPAIQSYLERIVTEIRRSFTYYRQESGERVDTILLSGGGVLIQNLFPYLTQHIGGDLKLCDPFYGLHHKEAAPGLEDLAALGPLYTAAYGLAQIAAAPPHSRETVNFLPRELRWHERRATKTVLGLQIGMGLLVSLGAAWLVTEGRAASIRSAIRTHQATYASLQPVLTQHQHLSHRQRWLEARLAFITRLANTQPDLPAILEGIVRALPERIALTELTVSGPNRLSSEAAPPASQLAPPVGWSPATASPLGRGRADAEGPWRLSVTGTLQAHYEAALNLLERLKSRLEPSPYFSDVAVQLPRPEMLQPRTVGEGVVELTQPQSFAFTLTATVR